MAKQKDDGIGKPIKIIVGIVTALVVLAAAGVGVYGLYFAPTTTSPCPMSPSPSI